MGDSDRPRQAPRAWPGVPRPGEEGGERVVDDERDARRVRDLGERAEVGDVEARVPDQLEEDRLGLLVDRDFLIDVAQHSKYNVKIFLQVLVAPKRKIFLIKKK